MADKKLNIKVGLKGAKKAEQGLGKVNSSMKSMAKTALVAGGSFFAVQGIIRGFSAVIKLAGVQEQAEKKLSVALGHTSKALLNQASALQKMTTFGDEAIIGVQASLAAFIKNEDQIKLATEATLDMAVAMGMDLKSAGDLVAKTLGSSTNAMSRYGIEVVGAVGSTERLESLTNNVAELFGGQAAAQADTMTGAMQQASNAMGDAGEQIGSLLAPAVTNIAEWFGESAKSVGDFFTGLTQTPLEKTIKELQELGASTEALMSLQKIQLERNLIKFNTELKNSKGFYTDINDLQSLITKNGEETLRNVDLMANGESKRLKLQKEFDKLEKERIAMIRRTGEFGKMNNKQVNELIEANTELINQNEQKEEDLISDIEHAEEMVIKLGEESVAHEKNLNILTNIKKSEAEILALKGMQSDIEPDPVSGGIDALIMSEEQKASIRGEFNERFLGMTKGRYELENIELENAAQRFRDAGVEEIDVAQFIAERKKAIDADYKNSKISSVGSLIGAFGQLNQASKGSALVSKRLAQGEAAMNTWVAVNKALAAGVPPWNIIQATAIGAMGLANVVKIESQQFAQGGIVPGQGTGDTVPAMLTPGEVILNQAQQSNLVGGMGGVTINVSAPLVDETILDTIIPAIEKAHRMNLA